MSTERWPDSVCEPLAVGPLIERPRRLETPERTLAFAVLVDALQCAMGYAPVGYAGHAGRSKARLRVQQKMQARAWIASPDTAWPFAFESICAHLDIDPERIRRALAAHDGRRRRWYHVANARAA